MANALILVFAGVGLIGVVLGIRAWRFVSRSAARAPGAAPWRRVRVATLIVGLALALVSFVWVTILGYPVTTADGPGRIVGWPFFVVYFDSAGREYGGFLSFLGEIGNFSSLLFFSQFLFGASTPAVLARHCVLQPVGAGPDTPHFGARAAGESF